MEKHQKRIAFLNASRDVYVKLGDWDSVRDIDLAIKRQVEAFGRVKSKAAGPSTTSNNSNVKAS